MKLANFKDYRSKDKLNRKFGQGKWIYIGRANQHYRLDQSPLANPYKRQQGQPAGHTLERYRKWLYQKIKHNNENVLAALRAIDEETVLVCWCHPQPCHGDVVMSAVKWLKRC